MKIEAIKLRSFRNHLLFSKTFQGNIDELIICGENGSGKTSILEAIFLAHTLKSFKKQNYNQILRFDSPIFEVDILENIGDYTDNLILKYSDKKTLLLNNEEVKDIAAYLYNHPIACYTPEYLGILSKEQQDRRSFIDKFIFYLDITYLETVKIYNRLINQKNLELENLNPDRVYIEALNDKIINLSYKIFQKRQNILFSINKELEEIYQSLPFEMENVFIKYITNIENRKLLDNELTYKRSLYGTHRDKIDMVLKDGNVIEKFSSTGQKKTFILLTLLSFIRIIERERKINIITLLDDFEATLDIKRAQFIRNSFKDNKRQIIYTGIDNDRLKIENYILI